MRSHKELASAYAKIPYVFTQGYLQADIEDNPVELQREALAATLRNGASEDLLALYELRTAPSHKPKLRVAFAPALSMPPHISNINTDPDTF